MVWGGVGGVKVGGGGGGGIRAQPAVCHLLAKNYYPVLCSAFHYSWCVCVCVNIRRNVTIVEH